MVSHALIGRFDRENSICRFIPKESVSLLVRFRMKQCWIMLERSGGNWKEMRSRLHLPLEQIDLTLSWSSPLLRGQ